MSHTPVLPRAVAELLAIQPGDIVVDATIGGGGHAVALAEAAGPRGTLIGLDIDDGSLALARERLACAPGRVELVQANFADLSTVLRDAGMDQADVILADLGINSLQLDEPGRGFSFQRDGPLDMRMNPRSMITATDLVNSLKERELGTLLYENAQEGKARTIARRICEERRSRRITRTGQLSDIVCRALRVDPTSRKSRIHPATRTFLALRMAVNDEVENLCALLQAAPDLLHTGGRIGVIAFHSVEDKPVKLDFRARKNERLYRIVTKKPVVADESERRENPRSRSAKFRVAIRLPSGD